MKKVLFLMVLLFLIGLGTAGVRAQVRIGGNTPPNAATVLDLNTNDNVTPMGNKGLALPRVHLASDTVKLIAGVANLTGMMVYNTTTTLGAGIYFWNGTTWVRANLPSTSAADSGKILVSNGTQWVVSNRMMTSLTAPDTVNFHATGQTATWTLVLDTTINITPVNSGQYARLPATGVGNSDICIRVTGGAFATAYTATGAIYLRSFTDANYTTVSNRIKCWRPSTLPSPTVTWSLFKDTTIDVPAISSGSSASITIPGLLASDICNSTNSASFACSTGTSMLLVTGFANSNTNAATRRFVCYRPTTL